MIPAGILSSDSITTITAAENSAITRITNEKTSAINAIELKGQTTLASIPADYTSLSNEVDEVKESLNQRGIPTGGSTGQSIRKKSGTNYDMEWADVGLPTNEQTANAVSAWLDEHPEATTTVEDHSLTYEKFVNGTLGFVTPEMYGAKGDGITDDTNAIQEAINTGKPVCFMPKTYLVVASNLDSFNSYVAIDLISGSVLVGNGAKIKLAANSYAKYRMFRILEANDVFIDGLNIIGDKDEHLGSTGEHGYGISIVGSTKVHINNCITQNCWGDGICISATYTYSQATPKMSKEIYINNHESYNNRRQGMSVEGCDGLYVDNMYIHNISGHNPQAGIDFEPALYSESTKFEYINNVFISNLRVENTVGASIYIEDGYSTQIGKYVFDNCEVENFRFVTNASDGNNGSEVHLNNITINQTGSKYAFAFNIQNENTKIIGNQITAYRNGTAGFGTFEKSNKGIVNLDNVSLIGGDSTMKLFNISEWNENALNNVVLNNLYAPNGCAYTNANNENKAQSMCKVSLAKDIVIINKSDDSYFSTIANTYYFNSEMAANRNLYLPWMYDEYELTIINAGSYNVILAKETSVKPSIYFDDITASKTITIGKGIAKLKFNTKLGAWILQNYIGNVGAL